MPFRKSATPLFVALVLGGCQTASADFPSLAVRDAERVTGEIAAPPENPPPPPRPPLAQDTVQRLANLSAEAARAHRAFTAAATRTARIVQAGRGTGVGSDTWASAQVALADLDALRSQAAVPLADLDNLYAARAVELDLRPEIAATRADVAALIAEEDAVLARLRSQLGG